MTEVTPEMIEVGVYTLKSNLNLPKDMLASLEAGDVLSKTIEEIYTDMNTMQSTLPQLNGEAVERVARALAPFMVRGLEGCASAYDYPLLPEKEKARLDTAAKAALAAMPPPASDQGEAT